MSETSDELYENEEHSENTESGNSSVASSESATESENRPPTRKRKLLTNLPKRSRAKKCVERGLEHRTSSGNIIEAKTFQIQVRCNCNRKCAIQIGPERQKEIFDCYWKKFDWSKKTTFLRQMARTKPIEAKKSKLSPIILLKEKKFTCEYTLIDNDTNVQRVCRSFFTNCLQINTKRVYSALHSVTNNPDAVDKRGTATSKNKVEEYDLNCVRHFISSLAQYESRYNRAAAVTQNKYLHYSLGNISNIYREYKRVAQFHQRKIVSDSKFREIFNTEFKLSVKRRQTDTCRECDDLAARFKCADTSKEVKSEIAAVQQAHSDLIENVNSAFRYDVQSAKDNDEKDATVLTFDLQKTLETPSLANSSVSYYKRQLWTFNLCVHDEISNISHMYIWSENIASRGGQEIGSCLIKHLSTKVPENTRKVILHSDSCGGQNRNIKIALLLKKFLSSYQTQIEAIEQKFFVSGHSYKSCDRSFSLIDKSRKAYGNIYTPNDWADLIRNTKKTPPKFDVYIMQQEDFFSSVQLQRAVLNSQRNKNGRKLDWSSMRCILFEKEKPCILTTTDDAGNRHEIKIALKKDGAYIFNAELSCLYPDGKSITAAKYKDLIFLLNYVTLEHHSFYRSLKSNKDATYLDYGLISDASDED